MIHLTLSGSHAGKLICGKSRESAINAGDEFKHYSLTKQSDIDARRKDICPECLGIWDEVESGQD